MQTASYNPPPLPAEADAMEYPLLMACPACTIGVSKHANACPRCGHPVRGNFGVILRSVWWTLVSLLVLSPVVAIVYGIIWFSAHN